MTTPKHWQALNITQKDKRFFDPKYMKLIRGNIGTGVYKTLQRLFECEQETEEANIKFNEEFVKFLKDYYESENTYQFEIEVGRKLGLTNSQRGAFFSPIRNWVFYIFHTDKEKNGEVILREIHKSIEKLMQEP